MRTWIQELAAERGFWSGFNMGGYHLCVREWLPKVASEERWGAGVETQKNVRGEIGGWGRVPFNEPYAPSLSTIDDGA